MNDKTNNMKRTDDLHDYDRALAKEQKAISEPKTLISLINDQIYLIDHTNEWKLEERNGQHVAYRPGEEIALLGTKSGSDKIVKQ